MLYQVLIVCSSGRHWPMLIAILEVIITFWITSSLQFTGQPLATLEEALLRDEAEDLLREVFQAVVERELDHLLDVRVPRVQVVVAHDVRADQVVAHQAEVREGLQDQLELRLEVSVLHRAVQVHAEVLRFFVEGFEQRADELDW